MHPFASFIRILARGPSLSRPLSAEEADNAMTMILQGECRPEQLGAFLMLMRYRTGSAEELAGMTAAARRMLPPLAKHAVQLDWPSYADKHRQLPWFVLSALLLAQNGIPTLMHGIAGEEDGHVGTRLALKALGLDIKHDFSTAMAGVATSGFAYLALESALPVLAQLFDLKPVLGLRSPVHSLARELNPAHAPVQMQGVFHPNYRLLHQKAALLLGQPVALIFKGGGGEAQRNPDKPCTVDGVTQGAPFSDIWTPMAGCDDYLPRDEPQDVARIPALWRGSLSETGPVATVIGTAAIALKGLGLAATQEEAMAKAHDFWQKRNRSAF